VPQPPPRRSPAASDTPPPRRAPAPSARARIGLGIDGLYGLQPGVAPGAHLHLGVRWPRFSLGLELRGALPTTVADEPGVVSITAATATALGCLHDTPVRYLALCALASGSLLVGTGAMFPVPAPGAAPLGPVVAVGGRAGAEVPLGRVLSLAAHAELAWVPTAAAFRVDHAPSDTSAQPWSTPGFAAGAAIEALVHFR
jgi:hypothetical protein